MTVPIIHGLSDIAARYDGVVLDIWGVVHQGGPAFPGVIDCLVQLQKLGRPVVFLSNAPRRAVRVERLLESKGISPSLHRGVVSSGEIARISLEARQTPALAALGACYIRLGSEADDDLLDGLRYRPVDDPARADFILAIGLDGQRPTVAHYETGLAAAAQRNLPMLCVNPDLVVVRLGTRELCAGALAARYKELGGTVHYFGKPYEAAYPPVLAKLGLTARHRVLAVGDGLETDIKGARAAGLDSLLVTGGILADALGIDRLSPPPAASLEAAYRDAATMPNAAIATLRW
ncbi:MAG: TIGR01459 family HAD-type hydrolase [Alphaproteobacteria bacterium]|nr:TIGR01459 family HAD-type hydrolase [Alphaproteobacteria bacterium]